MATELKFPNDETEAFDLRYDWLMALNMAAPNCIADLKAQGEPERWAKAWRMVWKGEPAGWVVQAAADALETWRDRPDATPWVTAPWPNPAPGASDEITLPWGSYNPRRETRQAARARLLRQATEYLDRRFDQIEAWYLAAGAIRVPVRRYHVTKVSARTDQPIPHHAAVWAVERLVLGQSPSQIATKHKCDDRAVTMAVSHVCRVIGLDAPTRGRPARK